MKIFIKKLIVLLVIIFPVYGKTSFLTICYCDNIDPVENNYIKKSANNQPDFSFGFSALTTIIDCFDAGFGFAAHLSKKIPGIRINSQTSFVFWGIAKDSTDVLCYGIEESFLKPVKLSERFNIVPGFLLGLSHQNSKVTDSKTDESIHDKTNVLFKRMAVLGFEFKPGNNQSIFLNYSLGKSGRQTQNIISTGILFIK